MKYLFLLLACPCAALAPADPAPPKEVRVAVVETLKTEVERLEGDALSSRKGRSTSWEKTVEWLKDEAAHAETAGDFIRVLRRFDAAVPNPRFHAVATPTLRPWKTAAAPLALEFAAEEISGEGRPKTYRVVSVDPSWTGNGVPQPGDELLAVSGRLMSDWSEENFTFCKWPLRSQCEAELYTNFKEELLSWHRPLALLLRLKRGAKTWETSAPEVAHPAAPETLESENALYPGFTLAYRGAQLRYFTSSGFPSTAILRLKSFQYEHDEEVDIDSISKEVRHFYDGVWRDGSGRVKTVVLDLIDNPGGAPANAVEKLFVDSPFQDYFIQYKRIAESETASGPSRRYWTAMFSGDSSKRAWLERIRRDGRWEKTPAGQFLPKIPFACPGDDDCETARFAPLDHHFSGRLLILTNRSCLASCTALVQGLKAALKERATVIGESDSGDYAGAKSSLDVVIDADEKAGFRVTAAPVDDRRVNETAGAYIHFLISATRAEDARGETLSGVPHKPDVPVAARYDLTARQWHAKAVAEALSRAGAK